MAWDERWIKNNSWYNAWAKLFQSPTRFSDAIIIGNEGNTGSAYDVKGSSLLNGYTFKQNTHYLIKGGTYTVDTLNGKFLSFENYSTLTAWPGEQVFIYGTDNKSPILITGTYVDMNLAPVDAAGTTDQYGVPNPPLTTPICENLLSQPGGLLALNATYNLTNPANDCNVFIYYPSTATSGLRIGALRNIKQIISDTLMKIDPIRTMAPPAPPTQNPPRYLLVTSGINIPKHHIYISGITTSICAYNCRNCIFDFMGTYNPNSSINGLLYKFSNLQNCFVNYTFNTYSGFQPNPAINAGTNWPEPTVPMTPIVGINRNSLMICILDSILNISIFNNIARTTQTINEFTALCNSELNFNRFNSGGQAELF